VSLGLQALDTALTVGDQPTATDLLTRISAEAGTAVGEVRRILDDLRPAALDDASLTAAMRRHVDAVAAGVPVELDVAAAMKPLPANVETAAYRIAQEALTNVIRHADAGHARLALATENGTHADRSHRRRARLQPRPDARRWPGVDAAPRRNARRHVRGDDR